LLWLDQNKQPSADHFPTTLARRQFFRGFFPFLCHRIGGRRRASGNAKLLRDVPQHAVHHHAATIAGADLGRGSQQDDQDFSRASLSSAFRERRILLPSMESTFTRTWSPSFSSSRTSRMRCSEISLMCNKPSVPGNSSTKAPNSARRTTLPR